jgi:hypothetical protein
MSLYLSGGEITGSYFYDSYMQEIQLKGIVKSKAILLEESDNGVLKGNFIGAFESMDNIRGTWTGSDGKTSYPFVLSLKSIIPGVDYGKRYSTAIASKSDHDIENFAAQIQGYIKNNDKALLAGMICYPVNVKINSADFKIKDKNVVTEALEMAMMYNIYGYDGVLNILGWVFTVEHQYPYKLPVAFRAPGY